MAVVSRVSWRRAGQYIGFSVTPWKIQEVLSRANKVFGSGGSTKPG